MIKDAQIKRSFKLIEAGIIELIDNDEIQTWVRFEGQEQKHAVIAEWLNFGTVAGDQVVKRVIIEKMRTNQGDVVRETSDWVGLQYAATLWL
jgi:hypothetical protein